MWCFILLANSNGDGDGVDLVEKISAGDGRNVDRVNV